MGKKIAFIGLGNMGGPMAGNLVKSGHRVCGFDLSKEACTAAAVRGVEIASSIEEVVNAADIIITMLPNGALVLKIWTQLRELVNDQMLIIDSSTIDVDSAVAAHALLNAKGCLTLDAPVSGGTGGAEAGTLTFMVGGAEIAFALGEEILEPMAGKIVHCGSDGAGQSAKICNNMILGISMIGVCEAFVLAEKLGLDRQALFDVASTSSGQCWSLNTYCPVPGPVPTSPANNDYQPGFSAALMLKDLRLAQEAALSRGAQTPLGAEAAQLYGLFENLGHGGEDFSSIVNFIRGR